MDSIERHTEVDAWLNSTEEPPPASARKDGSPVSAGQFAVRAVLTAVVTWMAAWAMTEGLAVIDTNLLAWAT